MVQYYPALLFGVSLLFLSCKKTPDAKSDNPAISQVLSVSGPIFVNQPQTTLWLEDFFEEPDNLDSLVVGPGFQATLDLPNRQAGLVALANAPYLSYFSGFFGSKRYDFLLQYDALEKVKLVLPDKNYRSVMLKGEMNNWDPKLGVCNLEEGLWTIELQLNPGIYQYVFEADGQSLKDPNNPNVAPGGLGNQNSVLKINIPDPDQLPVMFSDSFDSNNIFIGFQQEPETIYAFWQNQLLQTTKEKNRILVPIPDEAKQTKRSKIRVYGYNKAGRSNDILIPLEFGKVINTPEWLDRNDYEANIMYFTLIDRFNNGNVANDQPVNDDRVKPLANYLGGDLEGITQKIQSGYFKSLGVNSIWLSPITQNPLEAYQEYPEPRDWYTGYHGYWPISSSRVDLRFGGEKALEELVKTAHEHGINVLLDYVCNHVHQNHPIYRQHPEWATELVLPDGTKNLRIWDEQRLTTWFDEFLPTLDLENKEVTEVQSDSALFWVKKYGLDGYRQDATKHIPQMFWRTLTRKLKKEIVAKENRPIFQIGETYGSRPLIQSYLGPGMMEAQFDFPLYFGIREVFGKTEPGFQVVGEELQNSFKYFGHHSTMGYITGNHDQSRFISLAGGSLSWKEDAREAGFSRPISVGDPIGYKRLQMLTGFLMSIPGIPVIFYGDEIGLPGAGDPDNRRMMRFDNLSPEESETLNLTRRLANLRKNRMSLIYGDTEILLQTDQTLVVARYFFQEITLAAFNKANQTARIEISLPKRFEQKKLESNFGGILTRDNGTITLEIPANSLDILTD